MDSSTETPTENGSSGSVTVEGPPAIQLTQEQVDAHAELLREGIARGVEWFEFGLDEEQYNSMTEKEQTFTRLLDPMIWLMRESLISYDHDDCDECKVRRESGGNGLSVAIAEMLLGRV